MEANNVTLDELKKELIKVEKEWINAESIDEKKDGYTKYKEMEFSIEYFKKHGTLQGINFEEEWTKLEERFKLRKLPDLDNLKIDTYEIKSLDNLLNNDINLNNINFTSKNIVELSKIQDKNSKIPLSSLSLEEMKEFLKPIIEAKNNKELEKVVSNIKNSICL